MCWETSRTGFDMLGEVRQAPGLEAPVRQLVGIAKQKCFLGGAFAKGIPWPGII